MATLIGHFLGTQLMRGMCRDLGMAPAMANLSARQSITASGTLRSRRCTTSDGTNHARPFPLGAPRTFGTWPRCSSFGMRS